MRWMQILRLRVRSIFSRQRVESELDEELRFHFEQQVEAYVASGMEREQARRAVLQSFAGVEQRKEECRDMRGLNVLDSVRKDLHFSFRQLRKNMGFTATAVLVLALGLCAATVIFAFVDAALLQPLPYREPTRLVALYEASPTSDRNNLSHADYLDWRRENQVFQNLAAFRGNVFMLKSPGGLQPANGARVSDNFFQTLGVAPVIGRDFGPADVLPSSRLTAMLSYSAWRQRFGGRSNVVGEQVTLDGFTAVIVGVLPREFHFAPVGTPEFWMALQPVSSCEKRRSCHNMYGVARLKDGVSMETAAANLKTIAKQLEVRYPESNLHQSAAVQPLADAIVGVIRPILLVLLSGAGLLLLIAGINVAGLLVLRSESRKREIAVRTALGASAGRLIAQFVCEAVVLTAAATALGLGGTAAGIRILKGMISVNMMNGLPFLADLGLNYRVLVVAGIIALLSTLVLSLPPSLSLWSAGIRAGLAEASRGSAGVTWRKLGSKLVVVELAIAMVLLVGAGLLGKSLYRLLHVPLGLQPERLVTMSVSSPAASYGKDEQALTLARTVTDRVQKLPRVQSVGLVSSGAPLSGNGNTRWLKIVGKPWNGEHNDTPEREVSANYFVTLGATLAHGRYFHDGEDASKPPVAIVNQSFARRYFPNEDPLGKQIAYQSSSGPALEIVGIVENLREGPLDAEVPPVLYRPIEQAPDNNFSLVVRTAREEHSLLPSVAMAIREIDRDLVVRNPATMKDRINSSQSAYIQRSLAYLMAGFAALALVMGVVGLYGVVAYSVSRRSREIGIRMALGAAPRSVYRLVLGEVSWLTALGIGIGLAGAIAAATLMRGLLFGVSSWDVPTLLVVAAILAAAALLASFLPARRAASVNPVDALRTE